MRETVAREIEPEGLLTERGPGCLCPDSAGGQERQAEQGDRAQGGCDPAGRIGHTLGGRQEAVTSRGSSTRCLRTRTLEWIMNTRTVEMILPSSRRGVAL